MQVEDYIASDEEDYANNKASAVAMNKNNREQLRNLFVINHLAFLKTKKPYRNFMIFLKYMY